MFCNKVLTILNKHTPEAVFCFTIVADCGLKKTNINSILRSLKHKKMGKVWSLKGFCTLNCTVTQTPCPLSTCFVRAAFFWQKMTIICCFCKNCSVEYSEQFHKIRLLVDYWPLLSYKKPECNTSHEWEQKQSANVNLFNNCCLFDCVGIWQTLLTLWI